MNHRLLALVFGLFFLACCRLRRRRTVARAAHGPGAAHRHAGAARRPREPSEHAPGARRRVGRSVLSPSLPIDHAGRRGRRPPVGSGQPEHHGPLERLQGRHRFPAAPGFARATWTAPGRSSSRGSPRPTARSPSRGSPSRGSGIPKQEYPVYVQLHGLWDVAAERLRYLLYPYSNAGTSFAFEDGYLISPWAGGTCGTEASPRRTSGRAWRR